MAAIVLCKTMSEAELSTLSPLQRRLLKAGLMAHWREAADNVFHVRDPGCFAITAIMKQIENRRERACRRAAAGRALARLIHRGLLETCSRGAWRLTRAGLEAARKVHPEIQRPSDHELAVALASWMDERPVMIKGRRPRGSAKKKKMSTGVEVDWRGRRLRGAARKMSVRRGATTSPGPGIEVEMDF